MPFDDVYPSGAAEANVKATIEANIRATVNEATAGFWLQTDINNWIEEATVDMSTKALCVEDTIRLNLVPGQIVYTEHDQAGLSDYSFIHYAWYDNGTSKRSLQKINPRLIHNQDGVRATEAADGEPHYISLFGQQDSNTNVIIYPTPSADEKTIAEVTTITCTAEDANTTLDGKYFFLNSPDTKYYFWFDVDDSGTSDPTLTGKTGVEITAVATSDTAADVATAVAAKITAQGDFTAAAVDTVVTVTNADVGSVQTAADPNIAAKATGFTFAVTTSGGKDITIFGSKITDDVTLLPDAYRYLVSDYVLSRAYFRERAASLSQASFQKYIMGLQVNIGYYSNREVDSADILKIPDYTVPG